MVGRVSSNNWSGGLVRQAGEKGWSRWFAQEDWLGRLVGGVSGRVDHEGWLRESVGEVGYEVRQAGLIWRGAQNGWFGVLSRSVV